MEHPLVGRSRVRSSARTSEGANEPFPMYQSISSVVVLDPPFSSIRCSFTHSFIRLLSARSLRKSPFRETYKSVTKKRRKERRKRRFASKRRGGGRRERMCALLAFTESAVVQKNRITLHTIERMAANFRSSSFAATRQPTTFCRTQFQSRARLGIRGEREKFDSSAISRVPAPRAKIIYIGWKAPRPDLKLRNTNFEYGKWPLLNQNQATGWRRSHLSVVVHVKISKRHRQFLTRNRRLFSGGCGNGERPSNRNLPRASRRRRRRRSDL